MAKGKVGTTVASLGEYLREQRMDARLTLRQLAELTGVSNPYLSQIERGLRRPSAQVLQQLSKALRISSDQLYFRAGIVSPDESPGSTVEIAVLHDTRLTERQKQSLLDVYSSFLALNGQAAGSGADALDDITPTDPNPIDAGIAAGDPARQGAH